MIKVDTDPDSSRETGRNGTFPIAQVEVFATDRWAAIDGISAARGIRLRGGLTITVEAMDELAVRWQQYRREQANGGFAHLSDEQRETIKEQAVDALMNYARDGGEGRGVFETLVDTWAIPELLGLISTGDPDPIPQLLGFSPWLDGDEEEEEQWRIRCDESAAVGIFEDWCRKTGRLDEIGEQDPADAHCGEYEMRIEAIQAVVESSAEVRELA